MKFWELFKLLNFKQLIGLFRIFINHPLYVYPTFKATSKCMYLIQKEFPNIHGGNNKANAFRHALWNILLVEAYTAHKKTLRKALQFANIITLWHEDFSPNSPIERVMDLHNNSIGRFLVSEWKSKGKKLETTEIISLLHLKLQSCRKISTIEDAQLYTKELIFLED